MGKECANKFECLQNLHVPVLNEGPDKIMWVNNERRKLSMLQSRYGMILKIKKMIYHGQNWCGIPIVFQGIHLFYG